MNAVRYLFLEMHKSILTISRAMFLMAVVTVMIGLLGFEITLLRSKKTQNILTNVSNLENGNVRVLEAVNGSVSNGGVLTEIKPDDARPLIIKRYLERYKSPLLPYSDLIFKLSQTYNFDYYWIVAIAQQESNLCKKIPDNSFNCWGYGINSAGTLRFDNYELALRSFAEYLKREYFDKGRTTPEQIMKKYCPYSDGSWARGVQQFINEMENGSF